MVTNNVCRTCLKIVEKDFPSYNLDPSEVEIDVVNIKTKLECCVPEIVLDRVKNSILCSHCVGALNTSYDFRVKCLETEMKLDELSSTESMDSSELHKFVTEDIVENDESTFTLCNICYLCFNSVEKLKKHITTHNDNFKCSICQFQSDTKSIMEEHMKSHNNMSETIFNCSVCDYSTTDKNLFVEHKVFHTGEQLHSCTLCTFRSTHSSSLRRHMKVHSGERPFRCTECRYGATTIVALKIHMRAHTGERQHKCPQCPYTCIKKSSLRNHISRQHFDGATSEENIILKPYFISIEDVENMLVDGDFGDLNKDIDGESFLPVEPLTISMAEVQKIIQNGISNNHNDEDLENQEFDENQENGVFKCRVCMQPFLHHHQLKRHMTVHGRANKPFECTECGFVTPIKSHFQVHMNDHKGRKVYRCDKCEYRTIYWSKIKKHSGVHLGDKPFKCPYCNFRTAMEVSLNNHMLNHKNQEVYKCTQCPYNAFTESALKLHEEMHSLSIDCGDDEVIFVPHGEF